MSGFAVPHYLKAEVREIIRVAKRRRVALQGVPSEEQMDDPKVVEPFVKRYGNYPSDKDFAKLKAAHAAAGVELSPEFAMSNAKCRQLLREHRIERDDRAPSEAQLRLLRTLREFKRCDPPPACFVSEKTWESFMWDQLTRDDLDRAQDAVDRLALCGTDLRSLGGIVYALSMAHRSERDGHAVVVERALQMILAGAGAFDLVDNLGVDEEEAERLVDACGHLLKLSGTYDAAARDAIAEALGVPKMALRRWYDIMQMLLSGAASAEVSRASGCGLQEVAAWRRGIDRYLGEVAA